MRLFTDNPISSIKEDRFGFASYARVLKDTILQTGPLPFCVGIFGPWGSGKSSFMKMLEGLMKDEVQTIWFNPWKYDKKEDLWNALIQTILDFIIQGSKGDEDVLKKARDLALATTWLALKKAISALTAGIIDESNLDKIAESVKTEDQRNYRHINQFEDDFTYVVEHVCNGGKLVIFIDDLDRCLPENAITVLESIKLFIGNANCIFVLGIDHYVVEEGIKSRYPEKISITGRDYLDKIIQVPFFLPPVSYERLRDSLQIGEDSQALSEEIWNIIQLGMGGNPRRTKRFVNSFYLSKRFLNHPDKDLQRRLQQGSLLALTQETQNIYLAKILIFEMSFLDFYHHLHFYPGDWAYLEKNVIQQDDGQKRQEALEKKEKLVEFWKNASFQNFMRKTSGHSFGNYPPAPGDEIVLLLLQAITLVTDTSG